MQFNKAEIEEIKKDLNNVDSMLKALGPDQVDEFDELSVYFFSLLISSIRKNKMQ